MLTEKENAMLKSVKNHKEEAISKLNSYFNMLEDVVKEFLISRGLDGVVLRKPDADNGYSAKGNFYLRTVKTNPNLVTYKKPVEILFVNYDNEDELEDACDEIGKNECDYAVVLEQISQMYESAE